MVADAEQVQIDVPELLTRSERTRDTVFTAVMWAVYLYLWVPLLSFAAWWFGVELAYDVMVRSGGAATVWPAVAGYLSVIAVIWIVVVVWSLTNRARFRGAPRRKAAHCVTDEEIGAWFGVEAATLHSLRANKIAAVDFSADGRPSFRPVRAVPPQTPDRAVVSSVSR